MAKWLKLTRTDGTKELCNMDTCSNVEPSQYSEGSTLWWFGADADNSLNVKETIEDLAIVLGAIGKP